MKEAIRKMLWKATVVSAAVVILLFIIMGVVLTKASAVAVVIIGAVALSVLWGITVWMCNNAVSKYIDENITPSVEQLNKDFELITEGNLNVRVDTEVLPELKNIAECANQMVDMMRKDLYQDQLTGLYSRRAFYFEMEKYFQQISPAEHAALFMIDADYMKYVNDVYGHEVGDTYLKKVVELVATIPYENKLMARLGGDEFAVLIKDAESDEQIQSMFDACLKVREGCTLTLSSQLEIPVMFSVGMSVYPTDAADYHILLKEADNRMFQDKQERKKRNIRPNGMFQVK